MWLATAQPPAFRSKNISTVKICRTKTSRSTRNRRWNCIQAGTGNFNRFGNHKTRQGIDGEKDRNAEKNRTEKKRIQQSLERLFRHKQKQGNELYKSLEKIMPDINNA